MKNTDIIWQVEIHENMLSRKYFYNVPLGNGMTIDGIEVSAEPKNNKKLEKWIKEYGYEGYPVGTEDNAGYCTIIRYPSAPNGVIEKEDVTEALYAMDVLRNLYGFKSYLLSIEFVGDGLSEDARNMLFTMNEGGFHCHWVNQRYNRVEEQRQKE